MTDYHQKGDLVMLKYHGMETVGEVLGFKTYARGWKKGAVQVLIRLIVVNPGKNLQVIRDGPDVKFVHEKETK